MPRRRTVTRTREQVRSMFSNAIEELEPRTLLHTLTGSGTFEYKDAANNIVRVSYHNIQAELVFARVSDTTNELVLSEPTFSFQQQELGKDLFHLYVAQAGPGAFFSAAQVPAITANPRPMQPFTGSVPLTIFGSRGGLQAVATDGGSGAIYLGAKTRDTPANINLESNRPFLTDQFFGMGILGPRPNGRLTAGIHVEQGIDFDKFFWGGTISGQVDFGGSIDTFYAGSVLTGDTRGVGPGAIPIEDNFRIRGDVREFIVMGSIGTHNDTQTGLPVYQTGFDLQVDGTIGRLQSYNHILGHMRAQNDPAAPRLRSNQREIEAKVLPGNRGSLTHFEGGTTHDDRDIDLNDPFDNDSPRLGDNQAEFNNDTLDTAQLLGSFSSSKYGAGSVVVNGRLQNVPQIDDNEDFYGIPLMAGQTIEVRLLAPQDLGDFGGLIEEELLPVGFLNVYDPDGRIIGSDVNNVLLASTANKAFTITADRPGIYKFEVSAVLTGVELLANINYQLQIRKVGAMTIGAIASEGEIFSESFQENQIVSVNGDLGAIVAGSQYGNGAGRGVFADGGNLRVLDAATIGYEINSNRFNPSIEVFGGDIGMIRARTTFANLSEINIRDNRFGVGGSMQLIEAPNGSLLMMLFNADKRLGVARAADMATAFASVINVNADRRGADGIIDLIDVDGDFGTLAQGGPQITTGPGGNVRYIHVDGTVFSDIFFGRGPAVPILALAGESVPFTDDSGTQMLLEPNPARTFDPITGLPLVAGQLSYIRYGIREAGGNVLVNLFSTEGVNIVADGQQGTQGTAEIGEINANGIGALIVEDTGNLATTSEDDELELDRNADGTLDELEVIINGSAAIDVYEIVGGNFTQIINGTAGEIVNVTAESIGEIEAATLGLTKSHTGTLVGGNTILNTAPAPGDQADAGPFVDQRIGIVVNGDIVSARARQGLGNFIVNGSIQELVANADRVNTKGVHEGINGPIMTRPGGAAIAGGGELRFVQIGEGILSSGTGNVSFSGLFAHSRIARIVNQGEGSDIRGDIVSKALNLPTFQRLLNDFTFEIVPFEAIGAIDLDDGAIIGADIFVSGAFDNAWEQGGSAIVLPDNGTFSGRQTNEIGIISLEGKGGIMSSQIVGHDIGTIEVKRGFGIFNTSFGNTAGGNIDFIRTDGFGIRSSSVVGGASMSAIQANGSGVRLATTDYTSSVRYSETQRFDPFSGYVLSEVNDLHMYLGTSAAAPMRMTGDRSRSAVIDELHVAGSGSLTNISAYQIKSSELRLGSGIDSVNVRDYMDTTEIVAGRLGLLTTARDVHNADWRVTGPVGTVRIGGTWRGTSMLAAEGPNGQIGTFITKQMWGTLLSSNDINEVRITGDIGSGGAFNEDGERLSAGIDVGRNLGLLKVDGSILDGATIYVDNRLEKIIVGGDIQEDARVDMRFLGDLDITGELHGEFIVRSEQ
jgi:hypothetical protein